MDLLAPHGPLHQDGRLRLAAAVTAAGVLAWVVLRVAHQLSRWVSVGLRSRHIPTAPGCSLLFGNALQLVPSDSNCPWEKMLSWVQETPLVKFRILHRTGLVVNDARALKRVFQVGGWSSGWGRSGWAAGWVGHQGPWPSGVLAWQPAAVSTSPHPPHPPGPAADQAAHLR